MHQPFWQTLTELIAGSVSSETWGGPVHIVGITLDVPMEIIFVPRANQEPLLLATVPRWRWPTDFDPLLGRLRVECVSSAP